MASSPGVPNMHHYMIEEGNPQSDSQDFRNYVPIENVTAHANNNNDIHGNLNALGSMNQTDL